MQVPGQGYRPVPNPLDKKATKEHEDEMIRVKECLQGQHGFESQEECQRALNPPTNVEGFVSGKIWAIARVGDTSECAPGGTATIALVEFKRGTIEIFRNCRVSGSQRIKKCP